MITRGVLRRVFVRSLCIEALWNFERLQNIGFAFAILPALRVIYPDPIRRRDALIRHTAFFNTHPYMVSVVLGAAIAAEEDIAAGNDEGGILLEAVKSNLAGPLAAMGDSFFWATYRPFAALAGVALALLTLSIAPAGPWWLAPIGFFVSYNAVHLPFRYSTLLLSYRLRDGLVDTLGRLDYQFILHIVRVAGLVLGGMCAALYIADKADTVILAVLLIVALAFSVYAALRGLRPSQIIAVTAGASIVSVFFW